MMILVLVVLVGIANHVGGAGGTTVVLAVPGVAVVLVVLHQPLFFIFYARTKYFPFSMSINSVIN